MTCPSAGLCCAHSRSRTKSVWNQWCFKPCLLVFLVSLLGYAWPCLPGSLQSTSLRYGQTKEQKHILQVWNGRWVIYNKCNITCTKSGILCRVHAGASGSQLHQIIHSPDNFEIKQDNRLSPVYYPFQQPMGYIWTFRNLWYSVNTQRVKTALPIWSFHKVIYNLWNSLLFYKIQ